MAKNPNIQHTRMTLLTQLVILVTCQKNIGSFLLKVTPSMKNEAIWVKMLVQCKILWKIGSVLFQITFRSIHSSYMVRETFNMQKSMIFWQFASIAGCV